ncbi:MAG: proline--tRNA ligase [Deltaproteobacteria bacterium]|nr:proline--tRNA ligase [Deltaproteobacteria bacterium]
MRYSKMLIPTVKEVPADAQVISHVLMLRAGLIRKVAAGIYNYLPLGLRVLRKIEQIIREEMVRAGAQELLMPAVNPAELWQESGRWYKYGPELLRFKDRKGADYCVGPTHEEVITALVRGEVRSYKELPLNLFQIQSKFRDEVRPRFGLMRAREFIMKDAYSFDVDEKAAAVCYEGMYRTYCRIFDRCGLRFRAVEADTGNIGGNRSHEFQVLAESGEDAIVACSQCSYAANVEKAAIGAPPVAPAASRPDIPLQKVATPGQRTIDEVASFLKVEPQQIVKSLIYLVDGKPLAALCRGDHEINEVKLRAHLRADEVMLADDATIEQTTHAPCGFAGPVGLDLPIVADQAVAQMFGAVCGANEKDMHFTGLAVPRDVKLQSIGDLRTARAGDTCGRCGGSFELHRGVEVGQVFFLGTKYAAPMKCVYLGEDGKEHPMVMGCYGIGVGRTAAAAIEQNHDDDGIIWPLPIAPCQVHLLSLGPQPEVVQVADRLYHELLEHGVEVLYDDRSERPGVKFKDADLLGIPFRIAIGGKGVAGGYAEWRPRRDRQTVNVPLAVIASHARAAIDSEMRRTPAEIAP